MKFVKAGQTPKGTWKIKATKKDGTEQQYTLTTQEAIDVAKTMKEGDQFMAEEWGKEKGSIAKIKIFTPKAAGGNSKWGGKKSFGSYQKSPVEAVAPIVSALVAAGKVESVDAAADALEALANRAKALNAQPKKEEASDNLDDAALASASTGSQDQVQLSDELE